MDSNDQAKYKYDWFGKVDDQIFLSNMGKCLLLEKKDNKISRVRNVSSTKVENLWTNGSNHWWALLDTNILQICYLVCLLFQIWWRSLYHHLAILDYSKILILEW